ncbi:MAG: HAD hydrolase-like protein [Eubacterium sp.]|nr:HAD hydrolase-like protein [Eubacterium sp.]
MRYQCVLFDLDGTLLNSKEGVWRSFEYALEKLGHPNPKIEDIEPLIGPPIERVFVENYGYSVEDGWRGHDFYQEEYVTHGRMFKDPFFDGAAETIDRLTALGCLVGICTNKGETTARQIIEKSPLNIPLEQVYGPDEAGTRTNKVEIIQAFLRDFGCDTPEKRAQVLMVGDRYYDIEGAAAAGIDGAGVAFGNGTTEELLGAGAVAVVDRMADLVDIAAGAQ